MKWVQRDSIRRPTYLELMVLNWLDATIDVSQATDAKIYYIRSKDVSQYECSRPESSISRLHCVCVDTCTVNKATIILSSQHHRYPSGQLRGHRMDLLGKYLMLGTLLSTLMIYITSLKLLRRPSYILIIHHVWPL